MRRQTRWSAAMVSCVLLISGCGAQGSAARPTAQGSPVTDSLAARRDSMVRSVLATLGSRDTMRAEVVFENIQNFRGMTARGMLGIMNAFGASLGTGCEHCHVVGSWASEAKPAKQIARDMGVMVSRLQRELLRPIPGLAGRSPTVTCATCHNGRLKPRVNMRSP